MSAGATRCRRGHHGVVGADDGGDGERDPAGACPGERDAARSGRVGGTDVAVPRGEGVAVESDDEISHIATVRTPGRPRQRANRRAPVRLPADRLAVRRGIAQAARMAAEPVIQRYAAFTDDPAGGNPAGVVLDASALDDAAMQAIAADVGYSETAFVTGRDARPATCTCATSAPRPRCRSAGTRRSRRASRGGTSTGSAPCACTRARGSSRWTWRPASATLRRLRRSRACRRAACRSRPRTSPRPSRRWAGTRGSSTRRCRPASRSRVPGISSSRRRRPSAWSPSTTTSTA